MPSHQSRRPAYLSSFPTRRSSDLILAVLVILGWAITGPIFHFSDTWQLVINTSTTIITFLMVFLISCHVSEKWKIGPVDRKSTRLNSSHTVISYAGFCLKKNTHAC